MLVSPTFLARRAGTLLLVLAAAAAGLLARAPAPPSSPIRLDNPVTISVPVGVSGSALLPDNETLVVGGGEPRTPDNRETGTLDLPPAGALVNLRTKAVKPFTNEHSSRITRVACSADGSRVYTISLRKDPFVGVWDVKAGKSLAPLPLPNDDDHASYHSIASCPVSGRVAVAAGNLVITLGPTRDDKRSDLTDGSFSHDPPEGLAISPDEKYLACDTSKKQLVVLDLKSRKVVYSTSLVPKGANPDDWKTGSLSFLKSGAQLLAVRSGETDEVPEGKAEESVAAEDRGLFLIDVAKKRVTPLGMGHQVHTFSYALHPSEDWIVTSGSSRPDKPSGKDAPPRVGELRVYRFSTRSLALRVQLGDDFFPGSVEFTPDGKKLVAIDNNNWEEGKVRIWDFIVAKPQEGSERKDRGK